MHKFMNAPNATQLYTKKEFRWRLSCSMHFVKMQRGKYRKIRRGRWGIIISSERGTCDIPLEQA